MNPMLVKSAGDGGGADPKFSSPPCTPTGGSSVLNAARDRSNTFAGKTRERILRSATAAMGRKARLRMAWMWGLFAPYAWWWSLAWMGFSLLLAASVVMSPFATARCIWSTVVAVALLCFHLWVEPLTAGNYWRYLPEDTPPAKRSHIKADALLAALCNWCFSMTHAACALQAAFGFLHAATEAGTWFGSSQMSSPFLNQIVTPLPTSAIIAAAVIQGSFFIPIVCLLCVAVMPTRAAGWLLAAGVGHPPWVQRVMNRVAGRTWRKRHATVLGRLGISARAARNLKIGHNATRSASSGLQLAAQQAATAQRPQSTVFARSVQTADVHNPELALGAQQPQPGRRRWVSLAN